MSYETECSDDGLEMLNATRRLAGLPPLVETPAQTYERRTRNLANRREKFDRDLKAYICHRYPSPVAASRGSTSAGSTAAREEAGRELRAMTARAAGMKPKPQAVAASRGTVSVPSERDLMIAATRQAAGLPIAPAMSSPPVAPTAVPPAPPATVERQSAAEKAQAVATGVVDSVDPRGPAGKAIADAIKKQQQALSPEQRESLRTLKDILFNATKTSLLATPALAKSGAIKALVGYFNQWTKDERAEGSIDPDEEAAELWANVVDVVEGMRKLQKESAAQPAANPTVPGLGLSRTFTLRDSAGQPITKPLKMVRHPIH